MATQDKIDWSECPLIEVKQAVQGGAPVLRGTRMPVNAIVDNFDYGVSVSEIAEQFELPPDRIEAIVAYANEFMEMPRSLALGALRRALDKPRQHSPRR